MTYAFEAEGLVKRFGETTALAGVDLAARAGTVLGVLGPNGAGKTTAVRILATLLRPDAGRARVGGFDVVRDAARVRAADRPHRPVRLGRRGPDRPAEPGADRPAARPAPARRARRAPPSCSPGSTSPTPPTGRPRPTPAACAAGSTWPPAWSAGPTVIFLDEPTTGLDPAKREDMWDVVRVAGRRRLDRAADHAVPGGGRRARRRDHGDRPRPGHRARHARRAQADRRRPDARGPAGRPGAAARTPRRSCAAGRPAREPRDRRSRGVLTVPVDGDAALDRGRRAGSPTAGIARHRASLHLPSLDEVFFTLTGAHARRRGRRRHDHGRA